MTFESFLDIDVPEITSPREGLKLCWDTAYSEGYATAIQDFIRSRTRAQYTVTENKLGQITPSVAIQTTKEMLE